MSVNPTISLRVRDSINQSRIKHETWQYRMMKTDASLYIIGHEHFNKSMTLDVENRLMHYLMSVDKVHQVHNGRGNPQKH